MKLSNRVEEVSDSGYAKEVTERILALDEKIKKGTKSRKSMEIKQFQRGNQINKMLEKKESKYLTEINKLKEEINIAKRRINESEDKYNKKAEIMKEFDKKQNNMTKKSRILENQINRLGLSEDNKSNHLNKKEEKLLQEKTNLSKKIKLIQTRAKLETKNFNDKRRQFENKIEKLDDDILKLNGYC